MRNYWAEIKAKIKAATDERGVAAFSREAGVNRKSVEAWLECGTPSVRNLDGIAKALGCDVCDLFMPTPARAPTPTEEDLLAMVKARDKRIRELEAHSIDADLAAALATASPKKLEAVRTLLGLEPAAKEKNETA